MGSQVAALLALELPLPEVQLRLENFYLRGYFRAILWDLTLPIVAIMTGEAFSNRIKRLVGGPDLHVEGFCQKLFVDENIFFQDPKIRGCRTFLFLQTCQLEARMFIRRVLCGWLLVPRLRCRCFSLLLSLRMVC
jgi:hypothetical protein